MRNLVLRWIGVSQSAHSSMAYHEPDVRVEYSSQFFGSAMQLKYFASIAILLVLTSSSTVWACDCVTGTPAESFRDADVVFHGELIRITPTSSRTVYTFRVKEVFKGSPASELTLEQGFSNCDATFAPNILYRVYARRFEGKLSSGVCSGNELIRVTRMRTGLASASAKGSLLLKLIPLTVLGLLATMIWFLLRRKAHR